MRRSAEIFTKRGILKMKKIIALLMAALVVLSFAACGKKPEDESKAPEMKSATPAEIEAAIANALGDGYLATETVSEEEIFNCALGYLDMEKVKSYVAKVALITAIDHDTVVVAECEEGYADEAVSLFNENFANTLSYIRLYPFGVAKAEGARIYKVGNTVMYIIAGANSEEEISAEEEAKLAASEYEKIDNALKELFGALPENLAVIPKQ